MNYTNIVAHGKCKKCNKAAHIFELLQNSKNSELTCIDIESCKKRRKEIKPV